MSCDIKKLKWIKVDNSRGFCGLTLAGDTYFGEWYTERRKLSGKKDALTEFGYEHSFEKVAPLLPEKDYNIVNFEGVLTNETNSINKEHIVFLLHANPEKTMKELKRRNIHAVLLGNNHCMDFAEEIGVKSKEYFIENGFEAIGFGKTPKEASAPLCLECDGRKVMVFNGYWFRKYRQNLSHYVDLKSAGSACVDEDFFKEIAKYKKEYPDAFIIMSPHWGNDFSTPNERQKDLAKKAINSGVDCIIGHGPHIINNFEWVDNKFVVYSVGNFVFNQNGEAFVKQNIPPYAYVPKLIISKNSMVLRLYPIDAYNIRTFWQPCPVNDEQFEEIKREYKIPLHMVRKDEIGHYIEAEIFPFKEQNIQHNAKQEKEHKNMANSPVIFYGITNNLDKEIEKYIKKAGEPVAFSSKESDLEKYQGKKILDKYELLSLDEVLKRYPNADVWVTYAKAENTARMLLKRLSPEKIHFFKADLEYRKGCRFLGHFISYRKENFSPCCITKKCPVVKTQGSIPERMAHWQEYTTKLMDDIRKDLPNDCSGCHHLKYGFWRKKVELDMVSFGTNQPGDVCNYKCIYCFAEKNLSRLKQEEGYTTYEILRQLSEMPEYDRADFNIQLSNGEFCANKHCDEIFDVLLKTKWRVSFVTNMSIYREKFAEFLKTGRAKSVQTSLDAGTRETYKKVKGLDSFDKVIDNLKKYPFENTSLRLKYIFLEGINDNEADIDGFFEIVKEVGCKTIVLSSNLFKPFTEKMRQLTIRLIKKAKAEGIVVSGNNSYLAAADEAFIQKSYLEIEADNTVESASKKDLSEKESNIKIIKNGNCIIYNPSGTGKITGSGTLTLNDGLIPSSNVQCIIKLAAGSNLVINGDVVLGVNTEIELEENAEVILNSCNIQKETVIHSEKSIFIGENVIISPRCYVTDNNNCKICNVSNSNTPVVIKDNVRVGYGAMILKGVTIKEGTVITQGAIITKDIPPKNILARILQILRRQI